MPTTTEIATLPLKAGSDIGDPSNQAAIVLKDVAATLSKTPGVQRLYFGTEIESPDHVQLFIDWDKIEDHKTFEASEEYKSFFKNVLAVAAGPPSVHHVDFTPSGGLTKALAAPVTEVATVHYGSDVPSGAIDNLMKFRDAVVASSTAGFIDAAAGVSYEQLEHEGAKGTVIVLAIGWESVDAHIAFRETSTFKDNIHLLREGAKKLEMHHTAFLPYQS